MYGINSNAYQLYSHIHKLTIVVNIKAYIKSLCYFDKLIVKDIKEPLICSYGIALPAYIHYTSKILII